MKSRFVATALLAGAWYMANVSTGEAAPCLIVTLTGTQGGPQSYNGLAGAGTLVRYGEDTNACGAVKLQFDAGRGTTMRLAQLGIGPEQLAAVFFTHMHNDHTEGFADLVQLRWSFNGMGPKIDVVCSADAVSPLGVTISCTKFTAHIADAFIQSGEVAQRHSELKERTAGGPAELINTITFEPTNEPQLVWSSGDVRVSAVRSTHIAGHASYRVDTPAGSVVIGGDAGNDVPAPPRNSSTSEQVERLARGADIIVHSAIHPIMGPDKGSGMFPYAYLRQSSVPDLAAMAQRSGAKHLILTHLIPPLGADQQYPFKVPGSPLTEADYKKAAQDGGFTGNIIVGTDLTSLRLPAK
ncbi:MULTISPECIES: MBL fold metallo-hydrolase [unclassified Bradyrhizobium]|uniref:MBL fold metallo-hydrolase n=1 Tax=unclassified Bradyrhizobium TaxID=2631580 RepID=UPI00143DE840|nr:MULTISPECIES: MBL fold metallo-hydrolase [unclassified Bradyrhizobium]